MEAAKLEIDAPVDMRAENGRVIIEALHRLDYDLDQLLAGITPENIHDEVDLGGPTGRESL
jgi:antitoxin MazE